MKPRTYVAIAAALLIVGALILLGVTVHATTSGGQTVACGNGYRTDTSQAAHESNVNQLTNALAADRGQNFRIRDTAAGYQVACDSALSTRRWVSWGLFGAGVLTLIGALVVRRSTPASPPVAAA